MPCPISTVKTQLLLSPTVELQKSLYSSGETYPFSPQNGSSTPTKAFPCPGKSCKSSNWKPPKSVVFVNFFKIRIHAPLANFVTDNRLRKFGNKSTDHDGQLIDETGFSSASYFPRIFENTTPRKCVNCVTYSHSCVTIPAKISALLTEC
jgi:hypothetical protein